MPTKAKIPSILRFGSVTPGWKELTLAGLIAIFMLAPWVTKNEPNMGEPFSIENAHMFTALVHGEFNSPLFKPGYESLGVPPMTRYIAGAAIMFAGLEDQQKKIQGVPWPNLEKTRAMEDLVALTKVARCAFLAVTVVAILSLFELVALMGGRTAAWLFLTTFLLGRYSSGTLVRVMNEPPLLAFSASAALACVALTQRIWNRDVPRQAWTEWGLAVLTGFLVGMAACSKLNGLLLIPVAPLCVLIPGFQPGRRTIRYVALAGLIAVTAVAALIASYPLFYRHPIDIIAAMYRFRVSAMIDQTVKFPKESLSGILPRVRFAIYCLFQWRAPLRFPGATVANMALTMIGLGAVTAWGWGEVRRSPVAIAARVAGILWGTVLAGTALGSPLSWDRYYLFPIVAVHAAVAMGLAWIVSKAGERWLTGGRPFSRTTPEES